MGGCRKNLPLHDLRFLLMACGFAKPIFGLILLAIVIPFLPSRLLAIVWIGGLITFASIGEWHSRFRARRQVDSWCVSHGFSSPRWKPRGGFVSWGCSVWSVCEILVCEFDDSYGRTHDVLVDVYAPAFGFWVNSQVMASVNTVFDPEGVPTSPNGH